MKRQDKIEAYLKEPLKVGDEIHVQGLGSQDKSSWFSTTKVVDIIDGIPYIVNHSSKRKVTEYWKKVVSYIGIDPFSKEARINNINFSLESILFQLYKDNGSRYDIDGVPIAPSNNNPFIFIEGEKKYYQRPLVWELKDKQLLIESIYNYVDCGKIVVRNRGWNELRILKEGGHELAWKDIIDGKQRIDAVRGFTEGEFPDLKGNYFDDLSERSQKRFTSHQLFSYSELPENSRDEDVVRQFLRLNFSGVPQSEEHLNYIKSLL